MSNAANADLPKWFQVRPSSAVVEAARETVPEHLVLRRSPRGSVISNPGEFIIEWAPDYAITKQSGSFAEITNAEINNILNRLAERRQELKSQFQRWLEDAREEAEAHPGVTPLSENAERACLDMAAWVADRYGYIRVLRLVATAKLDGGASFVAIHGHTNRRLDVEFSPQGDSAMVFKTDENRKVSSEPLTPSREDWASHFSWLF